MKEQIIHINKDNHQVSVIENQKFNYMPTTVMPYGSGWQYNDNIVSDAMRFPDGTIKTSYYAISYIVAKRMSEDDIIEALIRCFYTINDELAIHRQRDTKPEKFEAYNEKIEQIKQIGRAIAKKF